MMSTLSNSCGSKDRLGSCLDVSSLSFAKGLAVLLTWASRSRQRRALSDLDDRLLKDIGLTRDQAKQEIVKPFWHE